MSKAQEVVAVIITLSILATIFVILRVVSRFGVLQSNYVDDYLVIAAVALSWSLTGLILARKLDYFRSIDICLPKYCRDTSWFRPTPEQFNSHS